MDSREWVALYTLIEQMERTLPPPKHRPVYSDVLVVALHHWHVAHDRPQSWACDPRSYNDVFRPANLPSNSRFNRRIRSPRCQALLAALDAGSQPPPEPEELQLIDARPLPIGACSKDRQAPAGRVYGGFARGYRLHTVMSHTGFYRAWRITPMNSSEKRVARELIDAVRPRGLLLGDGNYDVGYLYERVAQHGGQLLCSRVQAGAGRGHRPLCEARRSGLELRQRWAAWITRQRAAIDRFFGQHSSYGGGLAPLPSWVRTAERVNRWVAAKIILHHVRRLTRKSAVA